MAGRSLSEKAFTIFNVSILTLFMILCLYPILHVLYASLSLPDRLVSHRGLLLYPLGFTLESYKLVFRNPSILQSYANTVFYVVAGTSINLILTSFGAYVVSRKHFYIKNVMMFMMVFTMFFSGGLIPTYIWISNLDMVGTRWAILLPGAIWTYNLIIMRTYFIGLPECLEESAKIDGANELLILFRIILPVSAPVVAVMVLFYGVGHWNSWFSAAIYLRDRKMYPIQLILREILISSNTETMTNSASTSDRQPIAETIKYATIIIATIPILSIYPFLQKYFIKGIMIGAIK